MGLGAYARYTRPFAEPDANTDDSHVKVTEYDILVFVADDKPAGDTDREALRIKASDMVKYVFRNYIKAHVDFGLDTGEKPMLVGCAETIRGGAWTPRMRVPFDV